MRRSSRQLCVDLISGFPSVDSFCRPFGHCLRWRQLYNIVTSFQLSCCVFYWPTRRASLFANGVTNETFVKSSSVLCLVAFLLFCFMKNQSVFEICGTMQFLSGKKIILSLTAYSHYRSEAFEMHFNSFSIQLHFGYNEELWTRAVLRLNFKGVLSWLCVL